MTELLPVERGRRLAGRVFDIAPNQNIENNPVQSNRPVAGMCDAGDTI
jgi:hypothetical protein